MPLPIIPILLAAGAGAFGIRYLIRVSRNPQLKKLFRMGGGVNSTGNEKFFEGSFKGEMDREEALKILNLTNISNPTDKDVKMAHRKLMQVNHPDNGGSTYLSSKINEAKETLIGRRENRKI